MYNIKQELKVYWCNKWRE